MPSREPTLGERIAARAEGYVGTPYWIGGREPGAFLDCAGIVVCALRAEGVECGDPRYLADGMSDTLPPIEEALRSLARIDVDAPREPGDVLAFRYPVAKGGLYGVCHLAVVALDARLAVNAPGLGKLALLTPLSFSKESRAVAAWRAEGG